MIYMTLREANVARQAEWDPEGKASNMAWRLNELGGEVGEVCNVLKKLHRERKGVPGPRATKDQLAEELADVVICIDLVAMEARLDPMPEERAMDARLDPMLNIATLTRYGVRLLACMGRVCSQSGEYDAQLIELLDIVRGLAHHEKIDLRKAVVNKFNATSAKVGLQTGLSF